MVHVGGDAFQPRRIEPEPVVQGIARIHPREVLRIGGEQLRTLRFDGVGDGLQGGRPLRVGEQRHLRRRPFG